MFSSNYALYADMSRRVMDVLAGFAADVEVYSIDEAFLTLPAAAHALTARLFRPGCRYRKAGVILLELAPATPAQGHLFLPGNPREAALMATLDRVNGRYGPGTLHYAAAAGSMKHAREPWGMRQEHTSPAYTTAWSGLRTV